MLKGGLRCETAVGCLPNIADAIPMGAHELEAIGRVRDDRVDTVGWQFGERLQTVGVLYPPAGRIAVPLGRVRWLRVTRSRSAGV